MCNAYSRIAALTAILSSLCFAAPVKAGPLDYGIAAYNSADYATALRSLKPFADRGDPEAENYLGLMNEFGRGVPQDYALALKWYRIAAEQGDAEAQYNLASMYQNGKGVSKNYVEAVKWYRRAAEQGLAAGQLVLGVMYEIGMVEPKDLVSAYMWVNLAAAQSLQGAQEEREKIERQMTAAQVAEAQNLSREWRPRPER